MATLRRISYRGTLALLGLCAWFLGPPARSSAAVRSYKQVNLVADTPGVAAHTDPNLVNPWGLAFDQMHMGPLRISDNHSGVSSVYDPDGQPLSPVIMIPHAPAADTGSPTGVVFNGSSDFHGNSFIFASEDGIISGWRPDLPSAVVQADNSASGAVYKALAMGSNTAGDFLYVTNFNAGTIDVFDGDFHPARLSGSFDDPKVPVGFAPFGIHDISGKLYVTYAKQDADKHDDVKGDGNGLVDVFDTEGRFVRRFATGSAAGGKLTELNSPWGMALAPTHFGRFSKALLVANFGSGRIAAFTRRPSHFRGLLKDADGHPISVDGLWEVTFGGGGSAGDPHKLYFTSGPNGEDHGLFGSLEVARNKSMSRP